MLHSVFTRVRPPGCRRPRARPSGNQKSRRIPSRSPTQKCGRPADRAFGRAQRRSLSRGRRVPAAASRAAAVVLSVHSAERRWCGGIRYARLPREVAQQARPGCLSVARSVLGLRRSSGQIGSQVCHETASRHAPTGEHDLDAAGSRVAAICSASQPRPGNRIAAHQAGGTR
jgi:hypothetical protein